MNNLEMNTFEKSEEVRELSTAEVDEVAGGVFGPLAAQALLAYGGYQYYQWLKANDKI